MNIYKPDLVEIKDIIDETPDIKTFKLKFKDPAMNDNFNFRAGQFAEYSVFVLLHHQHDRNFLNVLLSFMEK
jgi:NAD(P)H-flavin reductase